MNHFSLICYIFIFIISNREKNLLNLFHHKKFIAIFIKLNSIHLINLSIVQIKI